MRQANVLAALPKSAHPGALAAMREILNAEDADKARVAITAFESNCGAKFRRRSPRSSTTPRCCWSSTDYPAEHWIHLRTTNPIVIWSAPDECL